MESQKCDIFLTFPCFWKFDANQLFFTYVETVIPLQEKKSEKTFETNLDGVVNMSFNNICMVLNQRVKEERF